MSGYKRVESDTQRVQSILQYRQYQQGVFKNSRMAEAEAAEYPTEIMEETGTVASQAKTA